MKMENRDMVSCACGDMYPADSYGAGFIAGKGHCENCDAAEQAGAPVAQEPRFWLYQSMSSPNDIDAYETRQNGPVQGYKEIPAYTAPQAAASAQPAAGVEPDAWAETLEGLFRPMAGVDHNQPGYHHASGWNDAIRRVMDVLRANTAPAATQPMPAIIDRTHKNEAYVTLGFAGPELCDRFVKCTCTGGNSTPPADGQAQQDADSDSMSPTSLSGLSADELIRQLQWALHYWMPAIAGEDTPDGQRAAHEAYLLLGMKEPVGEDSAAPGYWEKQQDADRVDAQRYRDIRYAVLTIGETSIWTAMCEITSSMTGISNNEFDRRIDAARAKGGQP